MKRKCGRPAGIPAVPAAAVLAFGLILYPAIAVRAAPEDPAAGPETEEYREDFMEDLGQEDLEALLSGSEDETISEQELEDMVNEWLQEDISAGISGSAGKKFAVRDDPDTVDSEEDHIRAGAVRLRTGSPVIIVVYEETNTDTDIVAAKVFEVG